MCPVKGRGPAFSKKTDSWNQRVTAPDGSTPAFPVHARRGAARSAPLFAGRSAGEVRLIGDALLPYTTEPSRLFQLGSREVRDGPQGGLRGIQAEPEIAV
jgi:hypothetical protein